MSFVFPFLFLLPHSRPLGPHFTYGMEWIWNGTKHTMYIIHGLSFMCYDYSIKETLMLSQYSIHFCVYCFAYDFELALVHLRSLILFILLLISLCVWHNNIKRGASRSQSNELEARRSFVAQQPRYERERKWFATFTFIGSTRYR